jgi:transcriptional regulator with XRE-family HTH domain
MFGRILQDARKRSGLTQGGLGNLCGITQAQVSRLESGADFPTQAVTLRLAKELKEPALLLEYARPMIEAAADITGTPMRRRGDLPCRLVAKAHGRLAEISALLDAVRHAAPEDRQKVMVEVKGMASDLEDVVALLRLSLG